MARTKKTKTIITEADRIATRERIRRDQIDAALMAATKSKGNAKYFAAAARTAADRTAAIVAVENTPRLNGVAEAAAKAAETAQTEAVNAALAAARVASRALDAHTDEGYALMEKAAFAASAAAGRAGKALDEANTCERAALGEQINQRRKEAREAAAVAAAAQTAQDDDDYVDDYVSENEDALLINM